jgi:MFS family permease
MAEFGITNAEAGLLMSVVLIPSILLSLFAGSVPVRKYNVVRVGIVSLACMVLSSLVTALADSFAIMLVGRFLVGIGGAFIFAVTPAIIAQWFPGKELGKAMEIFGTNMPLGTVIAFPTASVLALGYGLRFPFYVGVVIGLIALAVFAAVVKEGPFLREKTNLSTRRALGNFEVWKVGFVWLFFNASALAFTTWGEKLFETFRGVPSVEASVFASLLMWTAIFFVPVFGTLSDKIGKRKIFAILGLFLMTVAFVALSFSSGLALIASIMFLGVAAGMTPPIASALPAEILGPDLASMGFGITGTCLNIGASLAQPFIGALLDVTGSYTVCILGIASLSALGVLVSVTLKTR